MAALASLGAPRYVLVCPVSQQREGGTPPDDSFKHSGHKSSSSWFICGAAGMRGGVKFGAAARSWPETCGRTTPTPTSTNQDSFSRAASTLFTWGLASLDCTCLLASRLPAFPFPQLSGSRSVIKHVSSRITVRDDRALAPSLTFSAWIWPKR